MASSYIQKLLGWLLRFIFGRRESSPDSQIASTDDRITLLRLKQVWTRGLLEAETNNAGLDKNIFTGLNKRLLSFRAKRYFIR
jgi:hypothetical protein